VQSAGSVTRSIDLSSAIEAHSDSFRDIALCRQILKHSPQAMHRSAMIFSLPRITLMASVGQALIQLTHPRQDSPEISMP
jgi:hypothetical protein